MVADHVNRTATMLGYNTSTEQSADELSMLLVINGEYASRIVEGCNSVSVIILFLSFIVAFSGKWYSTIFYGLFGVMMIYVVNVLRIIAITILYYRFPKYQDILHDLFFPAIIYGLTFMLWVTWVKFFSNLSRKDG
jgi:exosortase family protein XrtF